jgi:hypothetical protein
MVAGIIAFKGEPAMTTNRFSSILTVLAIAALPAIAKPNFSGNWKLNVSKSNFGQMPAPDSATYKVVHEEPKLKSSIKQSGQMGEMEFENNLTTDGKESTAEIFGQPIKNTAKWDGDTLVIDSKGKFGDNEFTMNAKWTVSDDGKTLTVVQTFKSAMGEGEQKLILEKQ